MRKIILEESEIKEFEQMINAFPCFPKNVSETMAISNAVTALMSFMGNKVQEEKQDEKGS